MISILARARPIAVVALRSSTLIAITAVLIFMVFPALLTAAAPRLPIGG